MEKSSLKLISNIMLKEKYIKNPIAYRPYDLLESTYHDVRGETDLTSYQKLQKEKSLYVAKRIIIEENDD